MKTIHKLITLSALTALPLGTITAVQATTSTPLEINAEDAETKTVKLKITGMT